MITPLTREQRKQIANNLNVLVELSGYQLKVHYNDEVWLLQNCDEEGFGIDLISVGRRRYRSQMTVYLEDDDLLFMGIEALMQVDLGQYI